MLSSDSGRSTVRSTEHNRTRHVSSRHVVRLSGTVDDVVDGLHGKVPGHEFTDGTQPGEGGTDGETGETHFSDGRVDDSAFSKLVEQTLGDLTEIRVLVEQFKAFSPKSRHSVPYSPCRHRCIEQPPRRERKPIHPCSSPPP